MHILAAWQPQEARQRLEAAFGTRHTIRYVDQIRSVTAAIEFLRVDLLVLPPTLDVLEAAKLKGLEGRGILPPIVVYDEIKPPEANTGLATGVLGLKGSLLVTSGDVKGRALALVRGCPPGCEREAFLVMIASHLANLPDDVGGELREVIRDPRAIATSKAFAVRVGYSERQISNVIHAAGLQSVMPVLMAPRLIDARAFAIQFGLAPMGVIAEKVGLSANRLRRHLRGVLGHDSLGRLRTTELGEYVGLLVARAMRHGTL